MFVIERYIRRISVSTVVKKDTFISGCISCVQFLIAAVFGIAGRPEIGFPVVRSVPVNMVYDHSIRNFKQQRVEAYMIAADCCMNISAALDRPFMSRYC